MPRLLTRLPASNSLAATCHAVPLPVGLDVRVALPRVAPETCRGVVLASFVLRSRHDFQMVRTHAVPSSAQVVNLHPIRNLNSLEMEERPMSRSIAASVIADPVGVSVVRKRCRPQPASVCSFDARLEPSARRHVLVHAHEWHLTTGGHLA